MWYIIAALITLIAVVGTATYIRKRKRPDEEDEINMSKFYTEIVNSINVMLNLAGGDYIHPDNVKIVMLASY